MLHWSAITLELQSFMISWFHECSWFHGFIKVLGLMISWVFLFLRIHDFVKRTAATTKAFKRELMVSLFTSPLLFLEAFNTSCFRDTKNCCHRDGLLRARNPNASALPRIVERWRSPDFMVLPHFTELQLCFQAACPHSNPPFLRSWFDGAKRSDPRNALC